MNVAQIFVTLMSHELPWIQASLSKLFNSGAIKFTYEWMPNLSAYFYKRVYVMSYDDLLTWCNEFIQGSLSVSLVTLAYVAQR